MSVKLNVSSVVPSFNLGEIMISADRRSTKEQKLSDAERIRRVVLPANHWGSIEATINLQKSLDLTSILRDALKRIASDRLADKLAEDNYLTTTIDADDYTVAALLTWSADSASSRGSITFTRDEVTAWFTTSATRSYLAERNAANPKVASILALFEKRFGALAAKNHGMAQLNEAKALLASIRDADKTGDKAALVTDIAARIGHIIKTMEAKAAEETISMDDCI